jgi:hypothetical protein
MSSDFSIFLHFFLKNTKMGAFLLILAHKTALPAGAGAYPGETTAFTPVHCR